MSGGVSPSSKRQKIVVGQLYDSKHDFEQRSIVFSSQYPARVFKLMEVPNDLLKAVEAGEELAIVGNKAGEAILCSNSKTYGMKRVEQSNSVFFVPPSSTGEFSICAASTDYYEINPTQPKLDALAGLLDAASEYRSLEASNNALTLSDLLQRVQASRQELIARLRQLGAFELAGRVRTAPKGPLAEHRKALLETAITQGWVSTSGVCEVDERQCLAAMQASAFEADPVLLQCVLRSLAADTTSTNSPLQLAKHCEPGQWTLDAGKLKVASAHMLFEEERSKSPSVGQQGRGGAVVVLPLADFLLEWRLRTPGMRLQDDVSTEDLALLRGLAVLVDGKALHYLPVEELLLFDAKTRFSALFGVKARYQLEELQPYLEGLWGSAAGAAAPKTQQDLLTLFARRAEVSSGDGSAEVVYTAK